VTKSNIAGSVTLDSDIISIMQQILRSRKSRLIFLSPGGEKPAYFMLPKGAIPFGQYFKLGPSYGDGLLSDGELDAELSDHFPDHVDGMKADRNDLPYSDLHQAEVDFEYGHVLETGDPFGQLLAGTDKYACVGPFDIPYPVFYAGPNPLNGAGAIKAPKESELPGSSELEFKFDV